MEEVKWAKHIVERGDLSGLQQAFNDLRTSDVEVSVDWPTLFQKVYLHACLKGRMEIAEWMEKTVFPTLDPIQQIALRQGFAYGRHLLRVAEQKIAHS